MIHNPHHENRDKHAQYDNGDVDIDHRIAHHAVLVAPHDGTRNELGAEVPILGVGDGTHDLLFAKEILQALLLRLGTIDNRLGLRVLRSDRRNVRRGLDSLRGVIAVLLALLVAK